MPTFGAANTVTAVTDDAEIEPKTFACQNGYLDNLAAVATSEKTTLAQLIETNATLTANVTSLTASVASLMAAYAILATGKTSTTTPKAANTQQPCNSNRKPSYLAIGGYCWMHGYRVRKRHDSTMCKDKGEGHKDAATHANTMNGSMANKGWDA